MVRAIATECAGHALLKVIIETGELQDDDAIRRASRLAMEEGADFIKTSTGKVATNATPHVSRVMLEEIAARREARPEAKPVGFKPAGGIKTTADAAAYLALADSILGEGWAQRDSFRFGASGVLNDLLATLNGTVAETSDGY